MRQHLIFPLVLLLGMLSVFACDLASLGQSDAPTAGPTVALVLPVVPATATLQSTAPTSAPTIGAVTPGQVLAQDDFSNPKSGWQTKKEDCCEWLYQNGAYHIRVYKNNLTVYGLLPNQISEDTSVEVDAARDSGVPENLFGISCRMSSDYSQGYIFLIRSDGGHIINKVTGNNRKELAFGKQSSAIVPTSGVNHLRADCVHDRMTFYANGQKLIEAQDGEYKKGQTGLAVVSQGNGSVDIRFDNFIVRAP